MKLSDGDGVKEIAALLPAGSAVAVIASENCRTRDYIRALRRAGISSRLIEPGDSEERAREAEIAEDVRLVVSLGGEAEADYSKRVAHLNSLPVFTAICSPDAVTAADRYCLLSENGLAVLKEGVLPVGAAIYREGMSGENLPAAFGGICGCATALYDREAFAYVTGKRVDGETTKRAYDLIYAALDCVHKYFRADPRLPSELSEIALGLSALSGSDGSGFVRGAPDDCARTARMLFAHEQRACPRRGELAFIFGAVLSGTYRTLTDLHSSFLPPPDNNLRAELLGEYLGVPPLTAAKWAVCKMSGTELITYRLGEYREELSIISEDAAKVFDEGRKYFRRLYGDDGFSIRNLLDGSDIKTVISLAPDVRRSGDTALSVMRELGLLDGYLK